MPEKFKKGMVFGVFDGLHEGHKHFLADAASRCEALVVVVAQDEAVQRIKGKSPKRPLAKRMESVRSFARSATVIPGDETEGEWKVLRDEAPAIVFLGYDQKTLAPYIKLLGVPTVLLDAFQPDIYKSTFLVR